MNQLYKKQLIELAKKSKLDSGGFGWLAQSGDLIPRDKLEAWVNFRMTYVFALEAIHGNREVDDYLRHGLLAMKQLFLDEANGGYYSLAPRSGEKEREKRAYEFAFALLAHIPVFNLSLSGKLDLLAESPPKKRLWHLRFSISNFSVLGWSFTWPRLCCLMRPSR